MKNENPCRECPFWDEDSDGCAYPNCPPCDTEIAGFEVRVSEHPKPRPYVDYGENGGLYYVIECSKEQLDNVMKQYVKR